MGRPGLPAHTRQRSFWQTRRKMGTQSLRSRTAVVDSGVAGRTTHGKYERTRGLPTSCKSPGERFVRFSRGARSYRPLAALYLVPLVILVLNRTSRGGYLAPAYPLLFAAGGVALQPLLATRIRRVAAITVLISDQE